MDYETSTVVDEYAGWSSKRRCGYIFESGYLLTGSLAGWMYNLGTASGSVDTHWRTGTEYRCNCTQKYGPFTIPYWSNAYAAICLNSKHDLSTNSSWKSWAQSKYCPKGWGKSVMFKSSGSNYVQCGQGYLVSNITHTVSTPVYGYVTRYRTAYYNYIANRVAKS